MIANRITEILNRYCDQIDGGRREIEIEQGRFYGHQITLVWDGFATIEPAGRFKTIYGLLAAEFGDKVNQIVNVLHLLTFREKAEQELITAAIPSDLPWLASRHL